MPLPDPVIARLKRRWFVGEVLREAANWLSALLLLLGAVVLGVKLFVPRFWPDVLWLAWLALPLTGIVVWRAARRMPDDRELIALLDRWLNAGGLLMTLSERSDATWRQRLSTVTRDQRALPRLRPVRFAKAVAVPAVFAIGAGFVPPREPPTPVPAFTAGRDAARELADSFELLEQVDALDRETRDELRREVQQLETATRDAPLTHEAWETVDALRERLRAGLEATQLSIARGQSSAAALATASAGDEALTVERTEQLTTELREALETLHRNGMFDRHGGQPANELSSELQSLFKTGELSLPADAEAREQMLNELQTLLESEAKRLAETRSQSQQWLGGDGSGEALANREATTVRGQPGRGGVSRGPGEAELNFGDESDEQAVKFKAAVLPPGFLDRPGDTVQGVTASAPSVEPTDGAPRNAPHDAAPATGRTTWDRPLRPRHREIVREYFQER